MVPLDGGFGMWATIALILATLVLYALERLPLAVTSLAVICALMVLFQADPVLDAAGRNLLGPERLLAGFANPALLAVVALMVMGEGLVQTGAMERGAGLLLDMARGHALAATALSLAAVLVISAVLNNTPVVVIFIPIMQALSARLRHSTSYLMMPLSFAAMLGGMLTLIGSSTNLLVHTELTSLRGAGFGFFDFTVPGLVLAAVGLVYVVLVAPRLLPDRAPLASELGAGGKQFIAQITVAPKSSLIGAESVGGAFPALADVTVRMIQRGEQAIVPPFEDLVLEAGDVVVVAATRTALTEAVGGKTGLLHPDVVAIDGGAAGGADPGAVGGQMLAEVMVTPASRLIGQALEQIGFRHRFGCIALGIGRRSRMIRAHMSQIRLEAGDVLLIQGHADDIRALRGNPDILLMEWSAAGLPAVHHAKSAAMIFAGVIVAAATGLTPIVVAALTGAMLMLALGVINVRQAGRAIDRNLVMTIAAALALGAALQETGGARYFADALLAIAGDAGPAAVLSGFFLLVALLANIISTKATAVLFTPIAVSIAAGLGVPAEPFAVAVVFAANCCFASPVGYQTNLLVMGPGHYRFTDFARAGAPLVVLIWLAFSFFAPWYYGF